MPAAAIYLDNNATTRVDPRVLEAMLPFFCDDYGNAASRQHRFGGRAAEAVEEVRWQVAELLHASPREIVFTSGATESDNLALKGVAGMLRGRGDHLISAVTEHKAVLDTLQRLERDGFRVTLLPVDSRGQVSPEQVDEAITSSITGGEAPPSTPPSRTILVSLMAANNEIGTLHPLAAIGAVCRRRGVLFHTDAAQAAGIVPLDVDALGIDLLSLSGHKLYGPKGIGVLYVRRRVRLEPQMDGGGHERGLRSGTLNVPAIVGLGRACELCRQEMGSEAARLTALRERLREGIQGRLDGVTVNGHPTERLPGNLNLTFRWIKGEALLLALDGVVAASTGSACTSANPEPSHVLRAIGLEEELAHGSLRLGLGRFNTEAEVDRVVAEVVRAVGRLREISPGYALHLGSQESGIRGQGSAVRASGRQPAGVADS
jgi:cysteine desulfurase